METHPMRIRCIDLETTGIEPPGAGIVEIGWCDVTSTSTDLAGAPYDWVVGEPHAQLTNPGRPIPPEVSAINHIIDSDVAGMPLAEEALLNVLAPADGLPEAFAAHSAKFEQAFLGAFTKLPFVCTYKCALRLWPDSPSHSNQALRYWRKPEGLDRDLALVAHRAGPDAYVTAHHLRDMLNGGAKLEHLIIRSSQPELQVTCHIGAWRGKKWASVDPGFLNWLLNKDFDEDVIFTARHWLEQHAKEIAGATANG